MDDLISRQAAIEALKRAEALTRAFGYHHVIKTIRELSSVQPEPKTGRWIADGQKQKHGYEWMHCSVCGFSDIDVPATHTNFCPNCGARMEEGSDGECDLFRRDDDNTIVRTDGKKLYTVDVLDGGEVNAWETRMSRPHREECWYSDEYEKWVAVVYGRDEKEAKKRAFDLITKKKREMIERGEIHATD